MKREEIRAIYYELTARGATPLARNRALYLARREEEQAAKIARGLTQYTVSDEEEIHHESAK